MCRRHCGPFLGQFKQYTNFAVKKRGRYRFNESGNLKRPKEPVKTGHEKRTVLSVLSVQMFFSKASFSSFSAVFQNIPQKEPNFHCSKQEKGKIKWIFLS